MDMLFDPYADGPFQAASTPAAPAKASGNAGAGTGMPDLGPPGFGPGRNGHDGGPRGTTAGTARTGTAPAPRARTSSCRA